MHIERRGTHCSTIQNSCAHADKRTILNGSSMDDCSVPCTTQEISFMCLCCLLVLRPTSTVYVMNGVPSYQHCLEGSCSPCLACGRMMITMLTMKPPPPGRVPGRRGQVPKRNTCDPPSHFRTSYGLAVGPNWLQDLAYEPHAGMLDNAEDGAVGHQRFEEKNFYSSLESGLGSCRMLECSPIVTLLPMRVGISRP